MDAKTLLKALKNTKNEAQMLKIIPQLGKYAKGKTVERALVDLSESSSEKIRAAAIDALLINSHKRIKKLVMKHMTDTNRVKTKCFEYVGHHWMKQAEPILLAHLNDADRWVRYFAILNIGDMQSYDLIEDVEKHLENETSDVVKSGCYLTLVLLSDTEAEKDCYQQKLIQLLNSSDEVARYVTINNLADLKNHLKREPIINAFYARLQIESDEENITTLKNAIRSLKYW
ncbi:HEAT repeat domain-containing protein [Listeria welshimeri]|uniref:HEAT repeat domain-containing protein n=1 Tax=Listeria welshimeri TaxID=1643 RepID=UPI0010BB5089|nr:HEAT repeat domain-containing protein [Listeria welshimeri]MBC1355931.1 HEAT repeat domain-containing protein [Listeria welshimeri]MBC1688212.1 HEAT repeat domain-containing protein [Listeria welshimeri]MBC1710261.1 HEAT repeat domain-containing protein [Listeria welshimeri]MBC1712408.1 HEAT repeat domain-containing protein [Listeria welshimeri]MBC1715124.1 HEAT repeat domain-containing protein [Listeria welshimeri]